MDTPRQQRPPWGLDRDLNAARNLAEGRRARLPGVGRQDAPGEPGQTFGDLVDGLVAFEVFTGIGAIGAIGLGIVVHDESVTLARLAALALIVGGIVLARVATPE